MKKWLTGFVVLMLLATPALAFMYENVTIKTEEEVQKLSDQALEKEYVKHRTIDKAIQEFVISAGYSSAKDFNQRIGLLEYLYLLKKEIARREKLDPNAIDENLK